MEELLPGGYILGLRKQGKGMLELLLNGGWTQRMIRGYTVNLPLYLIRNRFSEVNRGSEVPNVSYLPVVRLLPFLVFEQPAVGSTNTGKWAQRRQNQERKHSDEPALASSFPFLCPTFLENDRSLAGCRNQLIPAS